MNENQKENLTEVHQEKIIQNSKLERERGKTFKQKKRKRYLKYPKQEIEQKG